MIGKSLKFETPFGTLISGPISVTVDNKGRVILLGPTTFRHTTNQIVLSIQRGMDVTELMEPAEVLRLATLSKEN